MFASVVNQTSTCITTNEIANKPPPGGEENQMSTLSGPGHGSFVSCCRNKMLTSKPIIIQS